MVDSLEIARRFKLILDNGPIYNEFVHDSVVREPWNAYSSLFFFIPVLFWVWRLWGEFDNNRIFIVILPLLFLNGLGSTLFHAFRDEPLFLLLDWLPASMMSFTLSAYFWTKVIGRWYWGIICVIGFYVFAIFTISTISLRLPHASFAPNIGYFFVGCSLLVPLIILLRRQAYAYVYYVLFTFIFLGLALLFRTLDYPTPNPIPELLPQGTHFLWHIFSSFAVFTLGFFIYKSNKRSKILQEFD